MQFLRILPFLGLVASAVWELRLVNVDGGDTRLILGGTFDEILYIRDEY
jgi:hypothetical protein